MSSLFANLRSLSPLWDALSPLRRRQLFALQLLSFLAALAEVANLGALLPFLRLLANPLEGLQALGPMAVPLRALPSQHLFMGLGLGFMAVVVVSTALRVFTIRFQLRLAALITADFGQQVFASVLNRPYAWHLSNNTSTVLTYLNRDVDAVFSSIQGLLLLSMNLLVVLLLGGSLIALAPAVMFTAATFLSAFYLLVFRFSRAGLRADGERGVISHQRSIQLIQESLGGIRDVLLDGSQDFFLHAYGISNQQQRLAAAAINIKAQLPRYLIEGFSMVLIVGVSLSLSIAGQGVEKQLPMLGTLALGAYRLLQPLQTCFNSLSCLQANQVAVKRLEHLLTPMVPSIPNPYLPVASMDLLPGRSKSLVELSKVCFRYSHDGPWVLKDFSLAITSGERIAFVGSTGSGKSTCSDLILGLLMPSTGYVLVEGKNLHSSRELMKAWQAQVAHVPQQIYLSDASFSANIAFGIPEHYIDHQRVRRAAEQAMIAELIEASPNGFGSCVGERGVRLSGGQRQRIGIARALYKQARLIVLDEATSALDNRTESEVMEALEGLDSQITVIMIAHRLSTVRNCNRVVLIEQGRISGIGTPSELEESHPGYQALANIHPTV